MLSIPIVTQFEGTGIKKAVASFKQLDSATAKAKFALKSLAVVGAAAVAALGVAAFQAGQKLFEFARMARDDEKAQVRLASSIRASTKATDEQIAAVEQFIDTTQRATGVADDELRPAYARIIRSTRDFEKAQRILKVALDVSAATGKPLKTVVESLSKAYDGNVKGLLRLGVGFSKTDLQSTSYVKVQKKVKEGTEGIEKAQYKAVTTARSFDSVLGDLEKRFSGSALDQANTYEGTMARFKITIDELKESLGKALLPFLKRMAEYGIQIADAFGKDGVAGAFKELKYILQTLLYDENGQLNAVGQNLNEIIGKLNFIIDVSNKLSRAASVTPGVFLTEKISGIDFTPTFGNIPSISTRINPGGAYTRKFEPAGANFTINTGIGDPVQIGRQVYNAINQFERRNGGR